MRTLHMFAGAGGGLLADLILGHKPVVAIEWDAYACKVLRARAAEGWFPELEVIKEDVRHVDFERWAGKVDCISAGFPCQDISTAGNKKGVHGERSSLYREVIRAVDAIQPTFVFLENSPNIRTRGRHIVIADLVARGYAWRDGQLAASDVGAPHRRNRWWCLAANANGLRQLQPQRRIPQQWGRASDSFGKTSANTFRWHLQNGRLSGTDDAQSILAAADYTASYAWLPIDTDVCGMAHGMANRMDRSHKLSRIKVLGNGQVPLVAAAAWIALGGPIGES